MSLQIDIDKDAIAAFCEKCHIVKLALFGSVLTDEFREDSDVDVLVDFDQTHIPSLFAVARMERELPEILGRKTDIRTAEDLSEYFRDEVVRSASVQYAA